MKKIKLLFLLLAPLFLSNLAVATEVVIATNISYADFVVASVVASKIGAYPYFVEKHLTNETLNEILATNPSKIYIIGGPAVVDEASENLLEEELGEDNVIRIWGMTRYGTSNEVAKYFWSEGTEKAILVWDLPDSLYVNFNVSQMVIAAAEEAENEGIPLLLIPKSHLPEATAETLQELGVKKVKIYGNVAEKVLSDLQELNISYEVIKGEPLEIVQEVQDRIRERLHQAKPLVIAAVANWQEGLVVRAAPGGVSLLVFSESEIPRVVEKVENITQTRNVSKILVTGKPELAEKIYNALIEAGINETVPVIWVTGKHLRVLKKIHEHVRERIQHLIQAYQRRLQQIRERLKEKLQAYQAACKEVFERIEEMLANKTSIQAHFILNQSKELYQRCNQTRNYEIARLHLQTLKHLEKLAEWKLPALITIRRQRVQQEYLKPLTISHPVPTYAEMVAKCAGVSLSITNISDTLFQVSYESGTYELTNVKVTIKFKDNTVEEYLCTNSLLPGDICIIDIKSKKPNKNVNDVIFARVSGLCLQKVSKIAEWSQGTELITSPSIPSECNFANFEVFACSYNPSTQTISLILQNMRKVSLKNLRVFVKYENESIIPSQGYFLGELPANSLKSFKIGPISADYREIVIKTHCPTVTKTIHCK